MDGKPVFLSQMGTNVGLSVKEDVNHGGSSSQQGGGVGAGGDTASSGVKTSNGIVATAGTVGLSQALVFLVDWTAAEQATLEEMLSRCPSFLSADRLRTCLPFWSPIKRLALESTKEALSGLNNLLFPGGFQSEKWLGRMRFNPNKADLVDSKVGPLVGIQGGRLV
ncbi:hypothetical protein KSP40_PGU017123 [Platanthera guangdongensis]|uniref:Uncharacterized protein n=1 Tax=Platanthera guangdongensis TaxID=2320717 RepID=A0ABR2MWX2_9ASPA